MLTPSAKAAPRTRGLPLIGSLPALLREPFGFFDAAQRAHGDLFAIDLGLRSAYVVAHPELAEQVLVRNSANYVRGGPFYASVKALFGSGLIVSDGEVWRQGRRRMNPHFHARAIAKLTENLQQSIELELAQYWLPAARSGAPCDVYPLVAGLTMSTALASMFGTRITRTQSEELRGAIAHALGRIIPSVLSEALPAWLPLPQRRSDKAARDSIARLIQALIDDRRRDASYAGDVAAMLIHASDAADMSERELHDQIFSLFFASYDTVSNALAWTLHLLACHPGQLARVRAEADGPAAPRDAHELPQLPVCERVFKEALRLYPSAALIPRFSLADDALGGYHIPAGSTLFVSVWGIQRNPNVWPRPELFEPDRFSPEAEAALPRLAWLPFGAGQHLCLGKLLALLEGQLVTAAVARQFDLAPLAGRPPRPRIAMNMAIEGGVWLRLRERAG